MARYPHRYTIWYGLSGTFHEIITGLTQVRVYNVDSRTTYHITRKEFAERLRTARNEKSISVVWENSPYRLRTRTRTRTRGERGRYDETS